MVNRIVRYECEKCRTRFWSWEEARSCEHGHIFKDAADAAVEGIRRAFARDPLINPPRRATRVR